MIARDSSRVQRALEPGHLRDGLGAMQDLFSLADARPRRRQPTTFSGNDDTVANPRATATSRASTHDFNRRNSPTAASSTSRSAQPASTAATRPTNSCTSTNSIHPL